jgi:HEPN domain-containing protein
MTLEQAVRNWVEQAEHDLRTAAVNAANGIHDQCAVSCEQAAEKLLKALWIYRNKQGAPRHHRIGDLAQLLGAPSAVVDAATALAPEYLAARYPDGSLVTPFTRYDQEDADRCLARAQVARDWVVARLAEEGWA